MKLKTQAEEGWAKGVAEAERVLAKDGARDFDRVIYGLAGALVACDRGVTWRDVGSGWHEAAIWTTYQTPITLGGALASMLGFVQRELPGAQSLLEQAVSTWTLHRSYTSMDVNTATETLLDTEIKKRWPRLRRGSKAFQDKQALGRPRARAAVLDRLVREVEAVKGEVEREDVVARAAQRLIDTSTRLADMVKDVTYLCEVIDNTTLKDAEKLVDALWGRGIHLQEERRRAIEDFAKLAEGFRSQAEACV